MVISKKYIVIAAVVLVGLQALVLYLLGHPVICSCGYVQVWDGVIRGPQNSQQMLDWYSFSHIVYGFIAYLLAWLIGKKWGWPLGVMFLMALILSVGWEIFENTHFAMSRFQHATIYTNYYGDSVINSVMDTVCVAFGFLLAYRLPVNVSVILVVAMELIMAATIHDNLTLAAIMFVHPFPTILKWQGG